MPKVKVLKGVAHNIGSSFTSLMNYAVDDYSMGHILKFARESGRDTLEIDLLSGVGSPDCLLRKPISALAARYSKMFLRLVRSAGSDRELVQSATLRLTYDLRRTRPSPRFGEPQSPYTCDISIVDSRGRSYTAHFDGWWLVESMKVDQPARLSGSNWFKPSTWFRRR